MGRAAAVEGRGRVAAVAAGRQAAEDRREAALEEWDTGEEQDTGEGWDTEVGQGIGVGWGTGAWRGTATVATEKVGMHRLEVAAR